MKTIFSVMSGAVVGSAVAFFIMMLGLNANTKGMLFFVCNTIGIGSGLATKVTLSKIDKAHLENSVDRAYLDYQKKQDINDLIMVGSEDVVRQQELIEHIKKQLAGS